MRFLSIIVLIICIPFITLAKKSIGYNRLYISFEPQYYFNNKNIINDGLLPDPIRTKNTFGYYFGLEYEHVTRYGLILNAGIHVGMRKHDIFLIQDMSGFDSEAVNNLKGVVFNKQIDPVLYYINPSIMLGYRKSLNKNCAILVKIGLFETQYINGFEDHQAENIVYTVDNNSYMKEVRFMTYDVILGEPNRNNRGGNIFEKGKLFSFPINIYEFYIGFERTLQKGWIKNISIGVEANREVFWNQVGHFMFVKSISNVNYSILNYNTYHDRNVSVGLKVAVGLWK